MSRIIIAFYWRDLQWILFKNLIVLLKKFNYLKTPYENNFILSEQLQTDQYVIVDDIHKSCNFKYKNHDQCTVAVSMNLNFRKNSI